MDATLDLGTGCGIQALLAAKHSGRVIATDVNERALAFARFNAALNGIDIIDFRRGHLLEPVEHECFDLVVANPPYVISPDSAYAYRDSGHPRDSLCRTSCEVSPKCSPKAHSLTSSSRWVHAPGEGDDWSEPLRDWVRGTGCDAWLLHYRTDDPLAHAAGWLRPLASDSQRSTKPRLTAGSTISAPEIEAVGYGAVVLRRRSDTQTGFGWRYSIERLEPATEHTLRVFAAEDYLPATDDRALLGYDSRLSTPTGWSRSSSVGEGRFEVESQTLALTDGLAFRAGLDLSTAMLSPTSTLADAWPTC